MKTLFASSSLLACGSLVAQVLSAATFVLAARLLAGGTFGLVVGLVGLVTLGSAVADFGLNATAVRHLARRPDDASSFAATLSVKVAMAVVLAAAWIGCSLVAVVIGAVDIATGATAAVLGAYLAAGVVSSTLAVPFRGRQRMGVVALANVVDGGVGLGAAALLVGLLGGGPVGLAFSLVAGSVASASVLRHFLGSWGTGLSVPEPRALVRLWHESVGFGLSSLSVQLGRADVALVALVSGSVPATIFAAPARLTTPLGILPAAFSTALFPRVSSAGRSLAGRREAIVATAAMVGLVASGLLVLFAAADRIVPAVLGADYAASIPVTRVYLVAMIGASANQPLSTYLQAIGEERFVARIVLGASIAGLVGVALGAHMSGATGAAFGFGAQQALILVSLGARIMTLDCDEAAMPAGTIPDPHVLTNARP